MTTANTIARSVLENMLFLSAYPIRPSGRRWRVSCLLFSRRAPFGRSPSARRIARSRGCRKLLSDHRGAPGCRDSAGSWWRAGAPGLRFLTSLVRYRNICTAVVARRRQSMSILRCSRKARVLPAAVRSSLFFLEAGVVGADALREHVIPISRLEHIQRLFLS
jgi:hypothetical protein